MIGQQLSIQQLEMFMAQTRIALGTLGENLVARALEKQGYKVATAHERGDLTVILPSGEIVYIEVKTSRRCVDKSYHFTLWKHWQGRQCADHRLADIVVLLCVSPAGACTPFVVPSTDIGDRRAVSITSQPRKYAGWLAPYRQDIKRLRIEL